MSRVRPARRSRRRGTSVSSRAPLSRPVFAWDRSGMSNRILIVLHQETSNPGRVGQLLRRRGFELDIRRPRFGDPLPETLARHAGAVVFGGPMSANDDEPYVHAEIDWLRVPLAGAGLSVAPRGLRPAWGRAAPGRGGGVREPGFRLWRHGLRASVPSGADA